MLVDVNAIKAAVDVCEESGCKPVQPLRRSSPASIEGAARLFRALGDEARMRLLIHLLDGERCVGDLAQLEGESLSTISQRLRVLRSEKVIVRRRQGKHVMYLLADRHIADLIVNATEHAEEPVGESSEALN